MPGKYRKGFVFSFNYRVWMNAICHRVSCIFVQLNEQGCDIHRSVIM